MAHAWRRSTLGAGVLVAAIWTDVQTRARSRTEQAALAAADAHLATLRHQVAVTRFAKAVTKAQRDALQTSIDSTMSQLATTNGDLANTNGHAFIQGLGIDTLQTCLGGVKSAFGHIAAKNNVQAAKDISAVSGACTQLAGGTSTGLVYPFDFPDPDVILVGQTYFAYATNSVAGNIQIIDSTDRSHWTAVGNALPSLPAWASANYTWAPAVANIGGVFVLYYAVDVAGTGQECISVATAAQPQGPFTDRSTAPLECQKSLGGSIDPASFLDTNGTPYLVWKSGGPGSSKIWSQQLAPVRHGVLPGDQPHRAAGTGPALGGRHRGGTRSRRHGWALLPLLLGQRLEQRQLRGRRRQLHGPARPLQRCLAETDPGQRAGRRRTRRGVRVRRQVGQLLDGVPRLGPRGRGIPQQPRPLSPPAHVLRPRAGGGQLGLVAARRVAGSRQRAAANASARRAIPGASKSAHS